MAAPLWPTKSQGRSAGIYHYEYAIYNQNLDRAVQSFSVPVAAGTTINNIGFHAPLNHPGIGNDGTQGDAGFSNAPWISNQAGGALIWNSETFAQNQNANAIRWGTMYNFVLIPAIHPLPEFRMQRSVSSKREHRSPSPFKAPRHAIRSNSPAQCRGRRMRAWELWIAFSRLAALREWNAGAVALAAITRWSSPSRITSSAVVPA